ncbi:hypothetical protein [Capnocytophaga sp.]|uniref:hypothetical protein n=1 Tax=Capnocytophaga sp. TaxID=44737 RepID=UPI0026DB6180|nr:hypothetical protein [Capnocytophaga sp.]MDO5105264.1 hypothetical protein [Capnocytophaga sp.]
MKTGRLFQHQMFDFDGLNGQKITRLVAVYEDEFSDNVVMVYLKTENQPWHSFFLEPGYGAWENWQEFDLEEDDGYFYSDKTDDFRLKNAVIERIFCTLDENENSRISIQCTDNKIITLKTVGEKDILQISTLAEF